MSLHVNINISFQKSLTQDASLTGALNAYRKGRNDLCAAICEEALQLLKHQRMLEDKLKVDFVGKSVHDTCKKLLDMNEVKLAEKLKNDYKLPDRRYWWMRIQSLADANDFIELEKFSKLKKSPIGYAPFVDICLQKNNRTEAMKYLPRVSDDIKVKYYVKAE